MEDQKSNSQTSVPTILLVEDDPLLVGMYRKKFENEGFNLVIAEDGEEGLKLATGKNISIIILDLMLPKVSGIELLTKLRKTSKGKNIPVIVLTNLSEAQEAEKVVELGAKEYLIKADLTPSQLVEKIKTYI